MGAVDVLNVMNVRWGGTSESAGQNNSREGLLRFSEPQTGPDDRVCGSQTIRPDGRGQSSLARTVTCDCDSACLWPVLSDTGRRLGLTDITI